MGIVFIYLFNSCNHKAKQKDLNETGKFISQQNDGSFLLKLEEADCYNDKANPSSNTAEWKFIVPERGRFKVWLSSATLDTTKLNYDKPVKINLLDNILEVLPLCDRIIKDSDEVDYPFFRTDSYMGSLYIPEPGEYNIQVISEKITNNKLYSANIRADENTRLMSLILIPMTR